MLTSAWHNVTAPLDVNNSSTVSPLDALVVINELTDRTVIDETGKLPDSPEGFFVRSYFDVNDDGFVSPLDALRVINELTDASARGALIDAALEQRALADPELQVGSSLKDAFGFSETAPHFTTSPFTISDPALVTTPAGNVVEVSVEWYECEHICSTSHILVSRRYAPDGQFLGSGWFASFDDASVSIRDIDVDVDSHGNLFVTWAQYSDGDWDVYLKRPDAEPELVNESTLGVQRAPAIALDADDNFLIVWQDDSSRRIKGRYYGAFEAGEHTIDSPSETVLDDPDPRLQPELITAADGYFLTWTERGDVTSHLNGLYLDPEGNELSSFAVSDASNAPIAIGSHSVATTPDGTYAAVTWQQRSMNEAGWDVRVRGFDLGTGSKPEVTLTANDATLGDGSRPAVAFEQGDLLVAWNGYGLNDVDGQFARRYDLNGTSTWISNEANVYYRQLPLELAVGDESAFLGSRSGMQIVGNDLSNPVEAAADDLVAFAKALADSGATFYGAAWCPHCTDQKELFEDGAQRRSAP